MEPIEKKDKDKEASKSAGTDGKAKRPKPYRRSTPRPLRMLVIDTEFVTRETLANPELMPGFNPDEWLPHAQPLLFGCAHLLTRKQNSRKWKREFEWTFYPDNLPVETLVKLRRHFGRDNLRVGDWREPKDSQGVKAYFLPLSEFLNVFYREAVSPRCLIVGYNLKLDISRLAFRAGPAKKQMYRGGFSFLLWKDPSGTHDHNIFRPRFQSKQLGERSSLMRFSAVRLPDDGGYFIPKCECLDLTQFTAALLGKPLTLADAAEALGLETGKTQTPGHGVITLDYFRYNRADVLVTAQVALAALDRFDKHPISRGHNPPGILSEAKVFSEASIAKAYLKLMGIIPRMKLQPNFPRKILAVAMEAYLGGRTECRIWGMPVPIAPLDCVSQYPTVAALQGLWKFLTAENMLIKRCTGDVRKFLKNITIDDLYNPDTWPLLNGFAKIKARGDILPVRAKHTGHGGTWKIGNNPYWDDTGQWFAIADIVASIIRMSGSTPEVLEAFRLIPEGIQPNLKLIDFGGTLTIDPNEDDFFTKIVEERARIKQGLEPYKRTPPAELESMSTTLKIMANAGCYGISAELNPKDLAYKQTEDLNLWTSDGGKEPQVLTTPYPEIGGPFYWPPLAALITAGGRLLLAMMQVAAESLGASYAVMDTDSVFVTYKAGGDSPRSRRGRVLDLFGSDVPIRCLNDDELDTIINSFDPLNPYDKKIIPHLWRHDYKEQQPMLVLSLGPKRYALFNTSREVIRNSEFGLGGIIPPTDDPEWRKTWWKAIGSGDPLPFGDGPLIYKSSIRKWNTYKNFKILNEGRDYQQQMKPFNFFITSKPSGFMTKPDDPPLLGPFEKDFKAWEELEWINPKTREKTSITLDMAKASEIANNAIYVRTIDHYFQRYKNFKPAEFKLPDGDRPGLLQPRHVQRESLTLIGKETKSYVDITETAIADSEPMEVNVLDEIPTTSTSILGIDPKKRKKTALRMKFGKRSPVGWSNRLAPILRDLPPDRRIEISEPWGIRDRSILRWADLTRRPANCFRSSIDTACLSFAKKILESAGVLIPAHKSNVIAVYAEIVPAIRAEASERLETYTDDYGPVAASREFEINYRTVGSWIDHPERIPVHKAIEIAGGNPGLGTGKGNGRLALGDPTETIQAGMA